jgi:hypothetical protein
MRTSTAILLFLVSLASGCATTSTRAKEARLADTPADRLANMPVPDLGADPENKDRRFGIESARERNETAQRKREERRRCVDVVSKGEAAKSQPVCPSSTK